MCVSGYMDFKKQKQKTDGRLENIFTFFLKKSRGSEGNSIAMAKLGDPLEFS